MLNAEETFEQLVSRICTHPGMYTLGGSYAEVAAYLMGYASATANSPISGEKGALFNRYVCLRFSYSPKYIWSHVIQQATTDDKAALALLAELMLTFIDLQLRHNEAAIIEHAQAAAQNRR